MTDCIAYDDDGSIMTLRTLNTITPIEKLTESRTIALFHLQNVEMCSDNNVNAMLPEALGPIGIDETTHYMCARPGYDNTIRNQLATMTAEFLNGNTWVSDQAFYLEDNPDIPTILGKFCFIMGDKSAVLSYLGLEIK